MDFLNLQFLILFRKLIAGFLPAAILFCLFDS